MILDGEREKQVEKLLDKYAIESIEEAYRMCEEKGIDVLTIINSVKKGAQDIVQVVYSVGVSVAIKRGTKLSSYVAMDIGEGIQAFCLPGTDGAENRAGLGHGYQVSLLIKTRCATTDSTTDYSKELDFMGLTNDELINITRSMSEAVEKVMKE